METLDMAEADPSRDDRLARFARRAWAALQAWLVPLGESRTWRAAGYLAGGFFLTWLLAVVVATAMVMSLLLLFVIIGIPLVTLSFGITAGLARMERRRARLAGVDIELRPLADGTGPWTRFRARITDASRWRQVWYFLTAPFVALATSVVVIAAWYAAVFFSTWLLWGWSAGIGWTQLIVWTFIGLLMLGIAPRVTVLMATLTARYAAWLLGPDRLEVMEQRVESLTEHRREILDAVAAERRRVERDLHDGVQHRLVALGIDIGLAEAKIGDDPEEARALLVSAREKARAAIGDLRVIGRGIHPAILDDRGLDAALSAVVGGAPIPIELRCDIPTRLPLEIEETAYFVVSEAVTNILKHADARSASVDVCAERDALTITVVDNGRGGADAGSGTGLAGITARVHGFDGVFRLTSPVGGPTTLYATLPYREAIPTQSAGR